MSIFNVSIMSTPIVMYIDGGDELCLVSRRVVLGMSFSITPVFIPSLLTYFASFHLISCDHLGNCLSSV